MTLAEGRLKYAMKNVTEVMLAATKRSVHEKRRMKKSRVWVGVIAVMAMSAYLATGSRYASYVPQRSDQYIWGVYHVHSTMSDGLQSPEEIAEQARAAGSQPGAADGSRPAEPGVVEFPKNH